MIHEKHKLISTAEGNLLDMPTRWVTHAQMKQVTLGHTQKTVGGKLGMALKCNVGKVRMCCNCNCLIGEIRFPNSFINFL